MSLCCNKLIVLTHSLQCKQGDLAISIHHFSKNQIIIGTGNVLKSPQNHQELRPATLNLINEESSVKEESNNQAYESLLFKATPQQLEQIIIKEPVHWSQVFSSCRTQSIVKDEDHGQKYQKYLSTNLTKDEIKIAQTNFSSFVVEFILFLFYMYELPLILHQISQLDYTVYKLQTQIPLLALNIILFFMDLPKSKNIFRYLPLTTLIPFICSQIDFNSQSVIFLQILHLITFRRLYTLYKKTEVLFICLNCHIVHFIFVRIMQIHFFQILCGFIIVICSQIKINFTQFFNIYCSFGNILLASEESLSIITYPIKIFVFIFIIYEFSVIIKQVDSILRNEQLIVQNLKEFAKLIKNLPINQRFEGLKFSQHQMIQRLNYSTQLDFDRLPENLRKSLLKNEYYHILQKLPIFKHNLNEETKLQILKNAMKEKIYEPNELIIEQNIQNPTLYIVMEGKVKCFQKRGQTQFNIDQCLNGIYNQTGFFLQKFSYYGVQSETSCRILEINWELFMQELSRYKSEEERFKMCIDRVQFNQEYELIGLSCNICQGNHLVDQCKRVHYYPNRQIILDYIYCDEFNKRVKMNRSNNTRTQTLINMGSMQKEIITFRHQQPISQESNKRPKTITSLGLQLDQEDEENYDDHDARIEQYMQNMSPVQQIAQPGSSASSYPLKDIQQKSLKQSHVDSFMVNQRRYQEKRASHILKIERADKELSPSIIKYGTIQEKKSQKSKSQLSEDHLVLDSSGNKPISRYGIQSSKFTNETNKQFMNNPFDMPLYDMNVSIDGNHSFNDYFPQHNVDQALFSYKQYQDSIISNRSRQQ